MLAVKAALLDNATVEEAMELADRGGVTSLRNATLERVREVVADPGR